MKKARMALRLGGALAILLVLLALLSCAESSKDPVDDNTETAVTTDGSDSSSGTDGSVTIDDYSATVEARAGNVTVNNGGAASRSLTATNESYKDVGELYWYYTAEKKDEYFSTGQTSDDDGNLVQTALNEGALGLPTDAFGEFSVGTWLFKFYGYEPTEVPDDTEVSEDDLTVTIDDTTYVLSLYYDGSGNEETTLLTTESNTVSVNVEYVGAESGTGCIVVYGITIKDTNGNEITSLKGSDTTYAVVTLLDSDGETISEITDSGIAIMAETEEEGLSLYYTTTDDDGEEVTSTDIPVGYYGVTVTFYVNGIESATGTAEDVLVQAGHTTTVTGDTLEVTVEAKVGTITISTGGTTTIYTLNADTENIINSTTAATTTVYYGSSDTYCRLTDTDDDVSEYVFDLNGNTFTVAAYDGSTVALEEGSTVTIKNGTLSTTSGDDDDALLSSLYVCDATLILDNVTYYTDPTGILVGDGGEVIIKNGSTVTAAGVSAISTNATQHTDEDGNKYFDTVKITIEDSTVTAVCGYSDTDGDGTYDDGDTAAILVNVNATLTISNSTITAGRQAVVVRGGTATISGSVLESKAIYEGGSGYASDDWQGGNEVPYATLVVGNRNRTYYEKADVTVTDTTITMNSSDYADGIVYVAAGFGGTSGSTACETTFTYSEVTGSFGDTTYSSGDDIVGSNYYVADGSTLTINETTY